MRKTNNLHAFHTTDTQNILLKPRRRRRRNKNIQNAKKNKYLRNETMEQHRHTHIVPYIPHIN